MNNSQIKAAKSLLDLVSTSSTSSNLSDSISDQDRILNALRLMMSTPLSEDSLIQLLILFQMYIIEKECYQEHPFGVFWESEFKPFVLSDNPLNGYVVIGNSKANDEDAIKGTEEGLMTDKANDKNGSCIKEIRTKDGEQNSKGESLSEQYENIKAKSKANYFNHHKSTMMKVADQIDNILIYATSKMRKQSQNEEKDDLSFLTKDKTIMKEITKLYQKEDDYDESLDNLENPSTYTQLKNYYTALVSSEYFDEQEVDDLNIKYLPNTSDLKSISINLLIKKICIEKCYAMNGEIVKGFLQQYPTFLKLSILIDKIINAYTYYIDKQLSVGSIVSFLSVIVLKRYENIKENGELFEKLQAFYLKTNTKSIEKDQLLSSILFLLESKRESFDVDFIKRSFKKRKKFGRIIFKAQLELVVHNKFIINFWTDDQIAKQLTHISRTMILNIRKREIIGARYAKKKKEETSPNVLLLIQRFDKLCCFIIEEILSYENTSERAKVMERWIQIGVTCRKMNNFNDTIIISTAFNNFIIKRLEGTWKKVSTKAIKDIEELKKFSACQGGYSNIRNSINNCFEHKLPYVPYLGLLLKEISYFEESMPSIENDTLINFEKIQKVLKSIKQFFYFSNLNYPFRPLKTLNILSHLNPKSEEELEKMAQDLEPKFSLFSNGMKDKHITNTEESYSIELEKIKVAKLNKNNKKEPTEDEKK